MAAPDPETFHQPIPLPTAATAQPEKPESVNLQDAPIPERAKSKFSLIAFLTTTVLSGTWIGAVGAFLFGYFHSRGALAFDMQEIAIFVVATFIPPILFVAVCWVLIRGQAMGEAAEIFADATEQLFSADESASRTAIRIGRSVRRELDALNAGLDTAFGRMRALEDLLRTQIEALDQSGGRLDERGQTLAGRLDESRRQIETAATTITAAAVQAGETMAGRATQLKSTIEAAQNSLENASGQLETQTAHFRQAASEAAEAPHAASVELDKQTKRIEAAAEAATARAEFVLNRQERHRDAMAEMLEQIKERGLAFETALAAEREAMERMLSGLDGEAKKFDQTVAETQRRLDALMSTASARTAQMAQTYAREAQHVKEAGEAAAQTLSTMAADLHKAGGQAQGLIGDTAAKARAEASALVGAAMGEVAKLLSSADQMTDEAKLLQTALAETVAEIQRHMSALPAAAQSEAGKVREAVRKETEEMLSLSARTLATLHARATPKQVLTLDKPQPREEEAGLGFFKRHLSAPKRKPEPKGWQMSALLAAAESDTPPPSLREQAKRPAQPVTPASALEVLQGTLADMAVDLDTIAGDDGPTHAEWRRYLEGDRGVFARKLANAVDGETVHRIAMLYRENATFRQSANTYLAEFEGLLKEARASGGGSLLATTLLSADTGKIYLAISYALGRL